MPFMYRPGQLEAETLRLDILPVTTYDREQIFPVASGSATLVPAPFSTVETVQAACCSSDPAVPGALGRSRFPAPVSMTSDSGPDHPIHGSCQVRGSSATPAPIPDALIR